MSKWNYDVVFYRVFCLSLLVIAFIFTVILTNVFIDIDGLLSRKEKTKSSYVTEPNEEPSVTILREPKPETIFNEEKNYDDTEDSYRKEDGYEEETYRNKRSIEARNFIFHLQNPNVKNILTNHLNALLEQMDAEEFKTNDIDIDIKRTNNKNENAVSNEEVKTFNNKEADSAKKDKPPNNNQDDSEHAKTLKAVVEMSDDIDNKSKIEEKSQNEMLHLAMHDILLQGIIGHMDLSEVYKKFNLLNKNLDEQINKNEQVNVKSKIHNSIQENPKNVESKFFEELIKCKDLQHQILEKANLRANKGPPQKAVEDKKPQMVVKTLIDISSIAGNSQQGSRSNPRDVKGIIKILYNGKPIKVQLSSSEEKTFTDKTLRSITDTTKIVTENIAEDINTDETETTDNAQVKFNIPQTYLNKAIANYFKKYSHIDMANNPKYFKIKRSLDSQRYKRHIKIHYDPKFRNKTKSDDDELYVEIETHFDSKGMKGEKRKKMIRSLIEKIEKAIHSNVDQNKTKKHYHAHVKKRIQNPLIFDNTDALVVKKISPVSNSKVEHRNVDPISKIELLSKSLDANKKDVPNIYDKSGEIWKKQYTGPGFLAPSKSLNSAEMSEVDVDYNRVMTFNGIPQRLQKPLNTDNSDEALATNYYDLGNLKFVVKDMDGSGISVGFNQYTDEEPDPETIKIFTGVDNLAKVYNHNYGAVPPPEALSTPSQNQNPEYDYNNNGEMHGEHTILRRSAVEEDYHSNEYKMVFDTNYLPYDSYQEIFERKGKNVKKHEKKPGPAENDTERPITMDLFEKKLKPSEIFSLANLLEQYRKKRAFPVKKYSNIKTRRKMNKYLQTKPTKLFISKKRLKRHIDKIRIIATDKTHANHKNSDENIFVVSNEDEASNRAVLSEVIHPAVDGIADQDKLEKVEEVYQTQPLNTQLYNTQMYDDSPPYENYITHVFEGRSRHNPLMSKYPHVFMEEISKSKESDIEPAVYGNIRNVMANLNNRYNIDQYDMPVPVFETTTENYYQYVSNISTPQLVMNPPNSKAKYKLTVKIVPKNTTEMKSGFKEIHTSINKSYDKDGLRFYSLVNVSEISKVENLDNIKSRGRKKINLTTTTPVPTVDPNLKAQQLKIKSLLKRHKQMIDMQLAHFKKERERLDTILIANQSDSDEVLDIKLPGESQPLQMKKGDISKILATVLRNDQQMKQPQNDWTTTVTTPTPQVVTTVKTTVTTTRTTTTRPTTTTAAIPIQTKNPDRRLINIIEKNGKLTKEILNKIDKNTEMLETFLVKLIDKIERPKEVTQPQRRDDVDKARDIKTIPQQEEFLSKHVGTRNNSNYAIPFIYAYQHPFVNPDKPNTPVANVVYHGHIHTDNPQIQKEAMNANPRIVIPRNGAKNEMRENKSKFFIDNDLGNGYKTLTPIVKTQMYTVPTNVTQV